jgi:hypothetical protein
LIWYGKTLSVYYHTSETTNAITKHAIKAAGITSSDDSLNGYLRFISMKPYRNQQRNPKKLWCKIIDLALN